jgi:hypothetical protein
VLDDLITRRGSLRKNHVAERRLNGEVGLSNRQGQYRSECKTLNEKPILEENSRSKVTSPAEQLNRRL